MRYRKFDQFDLIFGKLTTQFLFVCSIANFKKSCVGKMLSLSSKCNTLASQILSNSDTHETINSQIGILKTSLEAKQDFLQSQISALQGQITTLKQIKVKTQTPPKSHKKPKTHSKPKMMSKKDKNMIIKENMINHK